jgi:hypothetical protein
MFPFGLGFTIGSEYFVIIRIVIIILFTAWLDIKAFFCRILCMNLLGFAEKFRSDLMNIARTTLSSKILSQDKEHFAKLAVDAVMRLKVNSHYPTNTEFHFWGFS